MKLEVLTNNRLADFIYYCQKHRSEVDDSFLYDHDLKSFEVNEDNPTVISMNDEGQIVGVISLILNEYYRTGKQGRFRILHSEFQDPYSYKMLFQYLLQHANLFSITQLFIYVPTVNQNLINAMEHLDFFKERYAFLMLKEDSPNLQNTMSKDYVFKTFTPGKDEQIWCDIRNIAFAKLKGSQTPMTKEMAAQLPLKEDYLEGGMRILYHGNKPVGVVRVSRDEYVETPAANIGPVALIPEYQGRGLGRVLLREGLQIARKNDFKKMILSVNGENERAKALYQKEGFIEVEAVICYQYLIDK